MITYTGGTWFVDGPPGIKALVPFTGIRTVVERDGVKRLETIATLPIGDGEVYGIGWFGAPKGERVANARLLAAAPDLLAALKVAIKAAICPCCGRDNSVYPVGCRSDDCPGVAAIAKATLGMTRGAIDKHVKI